VVEVVEEEVGEELLGGAEIAAGSSRRGNKQRRLPLVWRSWRKTMTGKSRGPASPAGTAGRLSVQEGRGDEALLLAWSDSSRQLIGDGQRWAQWVTASSVTSGAVVGGGGATHVGGDDQRPPTPSACRAVSVATGNRGGARDWATVPCGQTEMGR
jgi:hypothetical protein